MGYRLGIDLGTTFTAAAVERAGQVEMVSLGDRSAAIPSVVLIRQDGLTLTGDAAQRRAPLEPDRVAREFKRRLGDPTPIVLGGAPHSVASVLARLLTAVVEVTAQREGGLPDHIVLTHPANWGPYKRELFDSVPHLAEIEHVTMTTEPEAAAAHYARNERVETGSIVAVYDFGGGTFDATVLRKSEDGFEILGVPEGVEGLGGIDFDEAILAFLNSTLDGKIAEADPADAKVAGALVRLRHECVLAKEALSADTEAVIPVLLPDLQAEIRLTRAELEEMMRPSIGATVASLRRALASAEVTPEDVTAVLLVGGSSRIPLVSQMVSAELGRPTAVDTHPKHSIALGAAALAAAVETAPAPPAGPATIPQVSDDGLAQTGVEPVAAPPPPGPPPAAPPPAPSPAALPREPEPAVTSVLPPVAPGGPVGELTTMLPRATPATTGRTVVPAGDATTVLQAVAAPVPPSAEPEVQDPASEAAPRRPRRRLLVVGVGTVALVAAVAAALMLNGAGGEEPGTPTNTGSSTVATTTPAPSTTATVAPAATSAAPAPNQVPATTAERTRERSASPTTAPQRRPEENEEPRERNRDDDDEPAESGNEGPPDEGPEPTDEELGVAPPDDPEGGGDDGEQQGQPADEPGVG